MPHGRRDSRSRKSPVVNLDIPTVNCTGPNKKAPGAACRGSSKELRHWKKPLWKNPILARWQPPVGPVPDFWNLASAEATVIERPH
jgi:hypothetical protein